MRLGDITRFAFEIDPVVPSWDRRTPSERGPWARLAIWIREENFCRNEVRSSNEVHDGVYVPLAPIANFFARNVRAIAYEESAADFPTDVDLPKALERWKETAPARGCDDESWDDSRYCWSERHFLQAGADGSWVPNLAFVRADDTLWISAGKAQFASPNAPRFLQETGIYAVNWDDASRVLSEFVDYVGDLLREGGLVEAFPWSGERGVVQEALNVELEDYLHLSLGMSADEATKHFQVDSLTALRDKLTLPPDAAPDESVALQILRDLELNQDVVGVALQCDHESRIAGAGRLLRGRRFAQEAVPELSPEEQGHQVARLFRRELGLDGRPLPDLRDLFREGFEIDLEEAGIDSERDHMLAGAHAEGIGKIVLLRSPQTQFPWARNMEALRGAGHLLLDRPNHGTVGAGSSNRTIGPRRRRSGAFAAEMLLPYEVVRERSGGILDEAARPEIFQSFMAEYGVGAQTAAWQCYNAGLLSSREVVEELIERHGAKPVAAE